MRRPRLEEKETFTVEEDISLFRLSRRKFWKLMNGMDTISFLAIYGADGSSSDWNWNCGCKIIHMRRRR